jgi:hypothetical protein
MERRSSSLSKRPTGSEGRQCVREGELGERDEGKDAARSEPNPQYLAESLKKPSKQWKTNLQYLMR